MIHKLKVATPDSYLVNQYLVEIAKAFKVNWAIEGKAPQFETQITAPIGYRDLNLLPTKEGAGQTLPYEEKHHAILKSEYPDIPEKDASKSFDPDFDELEKRFEALKKKK